MDIYDFIRSRAVAEHCRNIGKTWNTMEMAIIIGRSNRPLAEKHAAWRELIADCDDMPAMPNIHNIKFDSIHKKLEDIITCEQRAADLFKNPEQGALYRYKVWWNGEYHHSDTVFSCYEAALNNAIDNWEREEAPKIAVEKLFIDDSGRAIEAVFSYDRILEKISVKGKENTIAKWFPSVPDDDAWWLFSIEDTFYVDIPVPFKRGDILTVPGEYTQNNEPSVFVLDWLLRDDPTLLKQVSRSGKYDGSDMIGWGFFAGENGALYGDHTLSHDTFEYHTDKLEGNNRLLHYVSLYLLDEISLPALLNVQCRITAEHDLQNRYIIDDHGAYIPKELLAENRAIESAHT